MAKVTVAWEEQVDKGVGTDVLSVFPREFAENKTCRVLLYNPGHPCWCFETDKFYGARISKQSSKTHLNSVDSHQHGKEESDNWASMWLYATHWGDPWGCSKA